MPNPNKQCHGMMKGVDKRTEEERDADNRDRSPKLYEIMDAVGSGEITADEGVKRLKELQAKGRK